MTRLQLRALIQGLIGDNQVGEISAMDVRDALMAVYDSGILNAGGNGGVMLPIDQIEVLDLPIDLKAIWNAINLINTTVTPFRWSPLNRLIHLDAGISLTGIRVFNPDSRNVVVPQIELRTVEQAPHDGALGKIILGSDGMVNNPRWDDFVIELNRDKVTFTHIYPGDGSEESLMFKDGHITMPSAPVIPAFDDELVTYGQLKRITNITNQVTSSVSSSVTRAELITAMNTGGYSFGIDIKFVITADDDSSIIDVTYKSFGDTDQTGLNYEFYVNQQNKVI